MLKLIYSLFVFLCWLLVFFVLLAASPADGVLRFFFGWLVGDY